MNASDPTLAPWLLWGLTVVFATTGQLLLKAAASAPASVDTAARWRAMARRPWLWLGIGCFLVEFLLWLAFVSLVPLSAGVLLGSINVVAVMVCGRLIFGERLSLPRVVGVLLISLGVAVVGLA